METLNQFAAQVAPYAITGAIVSLLVQKFKGLFSKSSHKALLAIGLSVAGAVVLQLVSAIPGNWLTATAGVLASANTVYLLVIQWFEGPAASAQPQQ